MYFSPSTILALVASLASVALAADCTGGSTMFTDDIRQLADTIRANNINPQVPDAGVDLPALTSFSVSIGSARACVRNKFLAEHTHDSLDDIAGGVSDILNQCCSGEQCGGGIYTVKGDSGLDTELVVFQSGEECDGKLFRTKSMLPECLADMDLTA